MYISSFTSSSAPSLPGWRAHLYLRKLRAPNQQTNQQQDFESIQYLGTLKGHFPQWASGQRTQRTDRPWAQLTAQALLTGMDRTLDTHTPQPQPGSSFSNSYTSCPLPDTYRLGQASGLGITQWPNGLWPLHKAHTTLTQPPGDPTERESRASGRHLTPAQ